MAKFRPVLFAVLAITIAAAAPAPDVNAFELRGLFKGKPLFKGKQFQAHEVAVDTSAAARILSDYRKRHGLGSVTVDATLNRIAADHALKMAEADHVTHVVRGEGSFSRRLRAGGYDAAVAAENVSGGYYSLEDAFAGWRQSKGHNKNLLRPDVSVIGIARADSAGSKYGAFWALVLARPYVRPEGPTAGPSALPDGLIIGR